MLRKIIRDYNKGLIYEIIGRLLDEKRILPCGIESLYRQNYGIFDLTFFFYLNILCSVTEKGNKPLMSKSLFNKMTNFFRMLSSCQLCTTCVLALFFVKRNSLSLDINKARE